MKFAVENVFRTEGIPEFTFVRPPNFSEILIDMRSSGKPVIIEGQSGTGKTTTAKKILEECLPEAGFKYLTARKPTDREAIVRLAEGKETGLFIVDDFHRLDGEVQAKIANLIKLAAEEQDPTVYPKVVIIGINRVGSELIHLVHDIAKRCGIHRIQPASQSVATELIRKGEEKLGVIIEEKEKLLEETQGDYWLMQLICQTICISNNVTETQDSVKSIAYSIPSLRQRVTARLEHAYLEAVKEFCRGKRFRSTNDPYLKLLRCVSQQDSSIVDLTELANANPDVRGSINNIKEKRLSKLIESKPVCDKYFYYSAGTKHFAIEDPALFYYIKHLDWDNLRSVCGFRTEERLFDFDFAISFAGENRSLARTIAVQLELLDCAVFFDEFFETNYLGKAWHAQFVDIFGSKSRFVICLLDEHHRDKIWPTFEREVFVPRVQEASVIPIYLDDTLFVGIPRDIVGIKFDMSKIDPALLEDKVTDDVVYKLIARIDGE